MKAAQQLQPCLCHELVSDQYQPLHQASAPFQELAPQEDTGEALQEMKVRGPLLVQEHFPAPGIPPDGGWAGLRPVRYIDIEYRLSIYRHF